MYLRKQGRCGSPRVTSSRRPVSPCTTRTCTSPPERQGQAGSSSSSSAAAGTSRPCRTKASGAEIGRIPVDSIYSPGAEVTYKVEATRVDRRADWLILDVDQNSIARATPWRRPVKTLVGIVRSGTGTQRQAKGIEIGPSPAGADHIAAFALPIDDLDLTVAVITTASSARVCTVGELVARTRSDLLDIRASAGSIDEG